MFVLPTILIFSFVGNLVAWQPDIDNNRIVLLPKETSNVVNPLYNTRNFVKPYRFARTNDYDDHTSWQFEPRSPLHVHDAPRKDAKTTIKVHQPREDPRLFYQSDSYLKEANGQNVDQEISFIYPGREVVRADEEYGRKSRILTTKLRKQNLISDGSNICIRCPHDRTLIAKPGSDRVMLQNPWLLSCSGLKAPRNARFSHMFGPKFGSLVEQGSHMVIGRIMYKDKSLQLCKMQVHVVVQGCVTPKYLVSHCDGNENKRFNFTCRDPKLELHGPSSVVCADNGKWTGDLPICKARTWCEPPPPPDHGHVSCKGTTAGSGPGLAEGAKCRVRCARGWRWSPRAVAVCRRGAWTQALSCQKNI